MSKQLINNYYNKIDETIRYGGSRNETTVEPAFIALVNSYAERRHLMLVPKIGIKSTKGNNIIPDGTLKNALRLDFGYWESKDTKDNLDKEIQSKINKGYPLTNTLFEDSQTAVLFQDNQQVMRVSMRDPDLLEQVLQAFVSFEPPLVQNFNRALEKFTEDVPTIVQSLRELIRTQADTNPAFIEKRDEFYANCQKEINPEITLEDVREMMIQHILTADIFTNVFGDAGFHRHNNVAHELENVIETFMTRSVRQTYLSSIRSYYDTIRDAASGIADHNEKQKFLKTIYENFYKVYNPKGADRLGVVYTPNEIVRFMIESTDYLLENHFGKNLADKDVEILDPATGTGTFITDLINYIPEQYLDYKYDNEIHANEVAILPYYIANLNIEYTYQQKTGKYKEFSNICFVDTLDNTDANAYKEQGMKLHFGISSENAARILRQNSRKISVIIGNPPYNANQKNFNEFNANRKYKVIDKRFKDTFVRYSKAKKHKYDMYLRFYRWAMDRLDRRNGVIAFVTNRGFLRDRSNDGFRKAVEDNFSFAYIIDTKSDVIDNPKISGTKHNVFGIKEGVAIAFLVRKDKPTQRCQIFYYSLEDEQTRIEKLDWLREASLKSLPLEKITPDQNHNWLGLSDEDCDFESQPFLIDEDVKRGKRSQGSIFKLFSLGIATNRDDWVYDFNKDNLTNKLNYFIDNYEKKRVAFFSKKERIRSALVKDVSKFNEFIGTRIKFTRELIQRDFLKNKEIKFEERKIIPSSFRPFVKKYNYFDSEHRITHEPYQNPLIWGKFGTNENVCICINISGKDIRVLATNTLPDLHFTGDAQCLPFYRYYAAGGRQHNITEWGLEQFQTHYQDKSINRENIFHYTYSVLHHPAYRQKYELNLKREFPRLPFYDDFRQWVTWGKELMDLHINYEKAKPFKLKRVDAETNSTPRPKLKANKASGTIELDSITILQGVPCAAWDYKLGNRSALEWILDQYKEKKPSDVTIAEKFNTYRFADYKEQVVDLLRRVCTVSVRTVEITNQMPKQP